MMRVMMQTLLTNDADADGAGGHADGRCADGDDGGADDDGAHGEDGDVDGTTEHGAGGDADGQYDPHAVMRTMLMADMISRRGHPSLKKT